MAAASPAPRWLLPFATAAVLAGAALRLAWPQDMEWKGDEQAMYALASDLAHGGPLPWVGLGSGVGTRNPGMSVWVFGALHRLFHVRTPVDLGRAVMVLDAAALVGLLAFALTRRREEQEGWAWAATLGALNPGAVLLQRKIWAQSVLPLPTLAFLAAFAWRRTLAGAFLWGLLGACLGQIHMSGFFFAGGIALWTALLDRGRRAEEKRPVRWGAWLAGSVLGALPLVPWARAALLAPGGAPARQLANAQELGFWRDWLLDLGGLQLRYTLRGDYLRFLAGPRLLGWPTYGAAAAQAALLTVAVAALLLGARGLLRGASLRGRLLSASTSSLAQNGAFVVMGLAITLAGIKFRPHYLLVAFPLTYLWFARLALWHALGRRLLVATCALYLALSGAFLFYVHTHGGAPGGEYGRSWSAQQR
ncbi:hypothetical protein [Anaeromyxobacter paludicola]|uniref:Glycosyltransferase RgtA/B/C/D-like domain-containing protein n=1 Tax=Anaeromyxobacter paludicola TaxID=2918171 RepID=A0ABN6NEG6_9BACT|nr:hypothetical protein [Anaeromyxobacter paludicola]BDG10408.1 hypothetical protein AMPC_35210 [Anaeromyxobacter paludicola]